MSTQFPYAIDSYPTHFDNNNETISATTINNLQDAVVAIEQALGINLSNIFKKVNNVPTTGNFGVGTVVANVSEMQLTTTNQTNVLQFTPTVSGNYIVFLNIRVANATTQVTASVTWTDASGGQQTNMLTNNQTLASGQAFASTPLFINATTSGAITVTVTAGTANNLYVSATIMGV